MRPWDRHPPWAHWSFYIVWGVAGTLGPVWFVVGLVLGGQRLWLIGLGLCLVWVIDLALNWLLVQRAQRNPGWQPWQPPPWKWLAR